MTRAFQEHLDLKYRPQRFADVVGNHAVVRLLKKLSTEGRLSGRSLMFGGPKGCGKTSLARIVAKAVVCDSLVDGEPCSSCHPCLSVANESSDSFEEFDAATQGTVDRMRSIVDGLDYGNLSGKPFVYIMDEAHRLSKQAQDSLLKSVEDRRLVVIMCTTEPNKIQGAIRNRLLEFPVSNPSESEMVLHMEKICGFESISYDRDSLLLIAKSFGSCPRSCISLIETLSPSITMDSVKGFFRYESLEKLLVVLRTIDSSPHSALDILDQLIAHEGASWVQENIILAISSALRASVGARPTFPLNCDFYHSRQRGWADLARNLGLMDRPSAPGIEAALIAGSTASLSLPVVSSPSSSDSSSLTIIAPPALPASPAPPIVSTTPSTPSPPTPPPTPPPSPPTVTTSPAVSFIEIDGVKYTKDENLTTLDSKIETSPRNPPPSPVSFSEVELDLSKTPIPEKEFSRGFIQRIKKPN